MLLDKDKLEELYWIEKKSLFEIGKMYNTSGHNIRYYMKKYNIPRRTFRDGFDVKYANKNTMMNCEVCGKEFKVKNSIVRQRDKQGAKIKYCSIKCRSIGLKGRYLKSSDKLASSHQITQRLRKEVGKCEICGFNTEIRILTLHHKDGNHNNNSQDNHVLCCPNCHSLEHLKMGKAPRMPIVGGFKNKEHNFSQYRICWWCGKVFLAYRPSVANKFCSILCKSRWQSVQYKGRYLKERIKKYCKYCKKTFEVLPSRNDREFCSQRCVTKYRWKTNGKL